MAHTHDNAMQAMIFAAGLGTRLKPLTDTMPKALVPVGGEPLLAHVAQRLKEAGCGLTVVNVHHFAGQIIDYLKAHDFGLDVRISDESDHLLDTGGGIRHAQQLFHPNLPILIHNVDILSNVNLRRFYDLHQEHDATLLVSDRHTSRYLLFDDDMRLVGWTNVQTGEVRSPYPHLDPSHCRRYAFSGIHLFSPRLFPMMDAFPEKFGIIDFYLQACARADIRGFLKPDLRLMDVGKLDTLAEAEDFLSELGGEQQQNKPNKQHN